MAPQLPLERKSENVSPVPGFALLLANAGFWGYFFFAFAETSYSYHNDPLGHPAGAGITYFGRSIGIIESPFAHPFYAVMAWVQCPAFAIARFAQSVFFPEVTGDTIWGGISEAGWRLLFVVLLSFGQWHVIGQILGAAWRRFRTKPKPPAHDDLPDVSAG